MKKSTRCPSCQVTLEYEKDETDHAGHPATTTCPSCQTPFVLFPLSGATHMSSQPWRALVALGRALDTIDRQVHPPTVALSKWLQEWLHVTPYALALPFILVGNVSLIVQAPVTGITWLFILGFHGPWLYEKAKLGDDAFNEDRPKLEDARHKHLLKSHRNTIHLILIIFLTFIPLVGHLVAGTIPFIVMALGLHFADTPMVPPGKRRQFQLIQPVPLSG